MYYEHVNTEKKNKWKIKNKVNKEQVFAINWLNLRKRFKLTLGEENDGTFANDLSTLHQNCIELANLLNLVKV